MASDQRRSPKGRKSPRARGTTGAKQAAPKRVAVRQPAGRRRKSLRAEAAGFLDEVFEGPVVPAGAACFPVARGIDSESLHRSLAAELDEIRATAEGDPFTNPIQLLVLDISSRLHKGELSFSAIEALIQRLTFGGFAERADRLRDRPQPRRPDDRPDPRRRHRHVRGFHPVLGQVLA